MNSFKKKYRNAPLITLLIFVVFSTTSFRASAQIPTVQYTPLNTFYFTHTNIHDTARIYSNGLLDHLCAIYYTIYKDDTLAPIVSVDDYGSIDYTVRSYSTNYMTQSITAGTGYLSVRPLFTTYSAFTLGIFDNYCVARNRPVALAMTFDVPGVYKFECEIQSCTNTGSSTGTSFTANGAPGCGTASHTDYCASSCTSPTLLYADAIYLTICEQSSISYASGNTSYCPGDPINIIYNLSVFNDVADTTGLPSWLNATIDTVANTLTLTGTAPSYDPANPTVTFPVTTKISVNPTACPGSTINQTIVINNAPTPIITGPAMICEGDSVELLSNIKATWMSSNMATASITQAAPDSAVYVTGISGGTITISCEATTAGCTVSSAPHIITVNPIYNDTIAISICEGESYYIGATPYTLSGIYTDSLNSVYGCDSIVTLNLTVNQKSNTLIEASICQNETYTLGSTEYSNAGIYRDTLVNELGCDSIITLDLSVKDTAASEFWITDTSYVWNTISYTVSGDFTQVLTSNNGCDSVVTLHLTIITGLENNSSNIKVYPNPANDILVIELPSEVFGSSGAKLIDIYGQVIEEWTISGQHSVLNLSQIVPGIYFLNVTHDNKVILNYRICKQ